ncbi:MAG: type II restriction endonuclease [Candidatus Moranbacteria bacterium]|nr:type II restriction endonuclease [Candidatus Moranbacteria bacterium]
MLINPNTLRDDLERLEAIEKASLRLVVQAVYDFRETAEEIFKFESDLVADIGEDLTREALDKLGVSKIDQRLFGKIDYKKARYLFQPDFAIKQALFVDSKAEKVSGRGTATLQTSQLSLIIKQFRANELIEVQGKLPCIIDNSFITTTIFVKYNYDEVDEKNILNDITIAALPNGFLQDIYNPTAYDTIFIAGRNAPSRGEEFRIRLSFNRLKEKAKWRVQNIKLHPNEFHWDD